MTIPDPARREAALLNLETIHSVIARATRYTHISALGILLGGALTSLAGGVGLLLEFHPETHPAAFLLLWIAAFVLALVGGFVTSALKARHHEETFWSRKLRLVAAGFFPAPLLAVVLTVLLVDRALLSLAPGIWIGLYGVGILSVAALLDWEYQLTGWAFLVAGTAALFLLQSSPNLALLLSFGGIHLALSAYRFTKDNRCRRRQRSLSFKS